MKKIEFNNKNFIISMIILFICVIIYIIINFYAVNISWNQNYKDFGLEIVTQNILELGIIIDDESKLDGVKYDVSCGELDINKDKLYWNLTEAEGKCLLTAKYNFISIKKEYVVVKHNVESAEYYLDENNFSHVYENDFDNDGLSNEDETKYNTNPELMDTDMDNLSDFDEIFTYKTDPNKKDSDNDGLSDYDENELGLDPLKEDSKKDGIKDGNRANSYSMNQDGILLTINGVGNIASTYVSIDSNTAISSKNGLINNLYTFHTDGTINEVVVKIPYTDQMILDSQISEDNLSLYYYNTSDNSYEKVNTTIDKENKLLIATLDHFSSYVVGDEELVEEKEDVEVLFVIDNSWSMYTLDQYKDLTGEDFSGRDDELGHDPNSLRFSLSKDLVFNLFEKNYSIGLSEFRGDYGNILPIGSSLDEFNNSIDGMYGDFVTNIEGTNIATALEGGLKDFSSSTASKKLIILTDGNDNLYSWEVEDIIELANEKNIEICSIGFGEGSINTDLANISNATGCKFYSASDISGIYELFDNLETKLNDDLSDLDEDGENDSRLMVDSGFIVNRDGFSFQNYGTTQSYGGHCYGMASFVQLFYSGDLPLKANAVANDKISNTYEYNLKYTYFDDFENLYDYKLQTNYLKYLYGYEYFGEEEPLDKFVYKDGNMVFNSAIKQELDDSDMFIIETRESSLSMEERVAKYGFEYERYEKAILDMSLANTSDYIHEDDLNLLNAIYFNFARQLSVEHYTSGSDLILWLRGIIGTEDYVDLGGNTFINLLSTRIEHGEVPLISTDFGYGLHAVNAISLLQDLENPNYYYIGVYDNNYPGEKKYLDIECNKTTCVTVANEYYSGNNEIIRITPSLEYDLLYYDKYEAK